MSISQSASPTAESIAELLAAHGYLADPDDRARVAHVISEALGQPAPSDKKRPADMRVWSCADSLAFLEEVCNKGESEKDDEEYAIAAEAINSASADLRYAAREIVALRSSLAKSKE